MIRDDKVYLENILDAIQFIEKHCKKLNIESFCQDELVQNAMARQLEGIGEASTHVSSKVKENIAGVEWKKVIGMRNKLIHEYFGIDLSIVWTTIKEELPKLKKEIKNYLKNKKNAKQ